MCNSLQATVVDLRMLPAEFPLQRALLTEGLSCCRLKPIIGSYQDRTSYSPLLAKNWKCWDPKAGPFLGDGRLTCLPVLALRLCHDCRALPKSPTQPSLWLVHSGSGHIVISWPLHAVPAPSRGPRLTPLPLHLCPDKDPTTHGEFNSEEKWYWEDERNKIRNKYSLKEKTEIVKLLMAWNWNSWFLR